MTATGTVQRPRRLWVWILVALVTATAFAVPFRLRIFVPTGMQHVDPAPVSYRRDISDLQVQADGGVAVTIRAGRPGQVTVTSALSWAFGKPRVSQAWHGGTMRLGASCQEQDRFGGCQVSIVISVPPDTAVQAAAGAGTVTAAGLSGPLRLSATSGLLMVRDVSGPVRATVTSGSVVARTGLTTTDLSVSASTGQLTLAFANRPHRLMIAVGAGSADITLPPRSRYHVVRSGGPGLVSLAPGLSDAESGQLIAVSVGDGQATIGYSPDAG